MAHISLHVPFSALDISRCSRNENMQTVREVLAKIQVPLFVS